MQTSDLCWLSPQRMKGELPVPGAFRKPDTVIPGKGYLHHEVHASLLLEGPSSHLAQHLRQH